jgi:hypothetical protein
MASLRPLEFIPKTIRLALHRLSPFEIGQKPILLVRATTLESNPKPASERQRKQNAVDH